MTTESKNVEFRACFNFLILKIVLKNNIEHKKIKMFSKLTTSSLSIVIIVSEMSLKFHDDDTGNSHYDDKTAILLVLRVFKHRQQF